MSASKRQAEPAWVANFAKSKKKHKSVRRRIGRKRKKRIKTAKKRAEEQKQKMNEKVKYFEQVQEAHNDIKQGTVLDRRECAMLLRATAKQFALALNRDPAKFLAGNISNFETNKVYRTVANSRDISWNRVKNTWEAFEHNYEKMSPEDEGDVLVRMRKATPNPREDLAKKRAPPEREFRTFPKRDGSYKYLEDAVIKCLAQKAEGRVTLENLRSMMITDLGISAKVSTKTISAFLHSKLGFEYQKANKMIRKLTPERLARIRRFFFEYADALLKERAGTHVIVLMDESYVHQGHGAFAEEWMKVDRDTRESHKDTTPTDKGKRLIIVHAMTKDGLLMDKGGDYLQHTIQDGTPDIRRDPLVGVDREIAQGKAVADSALAEHATAELIFPSGRFKDKNGNYLGNEVRGDYHDNFDGDTFMLWVKRRLTPAFQARYPGKKIILILDNAPYHHGKCDDYIACRPEDSSNFSQLYKYCDELGINEIKLTVDSNSSRRRKNAFNWKDGDPPITVNFERVPQGDTPKDGHKLWLKNGGAYQGKTFPREAGVMLEELKAYVRQVCLEKAPHRLCSAIVRYFYFEGRDWELIWTPPYCCDLQPIEMLWARVKGRLARMHNRQRRVLELYDDIIVAFYGGRMMSCTLDGGRELSTSSLEPLSPEDAKKLFDHALAPGQRPPDKTPSAVNIRLRRDPVLGKEGLNCEHLENVIEMLAADQIDNELQRHMSDCGAFPDRRLARHCVRSAEELAEEEVEEQIDDDVGYALRSRGPPLPL